MTLPVWMRRAMLAAAALNVMGAVAMMPAAGALRRFGGLPNDGESFYMVTLGAMILIFGIAYLWAGVTGVVDRLFLSVAAAGKLTFFGLLVVYALRGDLPATAPMAGVGDGIFGTLFVVWLVSTRRIRAAGAGQTTPESGRAHGRGYGGLRREGTAEQLARSRSRVTGGCAREHRFRGVDD